MTHIHSVNRDCLTNYEKEEILHYHEKEIHYTGETAIKTEPENNDSRAFEDHSGKYIAIKDDHLNYRYQVLNEVGYGTFSTVVRAYDHKLKKTVAIKMLRNVKVSTIFENELDILTTITSRRGRRKNVVQLLDYFHFRNHDFLVFDILSVDLETLVIQNVHFDVDSIKIIAKDVLKAIKFIHKLKIIHGDVKLQNIVLQGPQSKNVKLVDFGCCHYKKRGNIARYIQSRRYRAPEVLLRSIFSTEIDIWSMGVCLYELYAGDCIFDGKTEEDCMVQIVEVIGLPPRKLLHSWQQVSLRARTYFTEDGILSYQERRHWTRETMGLANGTPGIRALERLVDVKTYSLFYNFLETFLEWDPKERTTAKQALRHSWIAGEGRCCPILK